MNGGPELARLMARRGIRDERVLAAVASVPRELFVPDDLRRHAYADRALPIGSGQTISQPFMVATMLEALELDGGRVLEIGTGSGYQAALLAELADEVVTIERVPELAEEAQRTLERAGYGRVDVRVGDGTLGVPEQAPFDGIVVAAAAPAVPASLYEQLAPGGRIVVPVGTQRDQWLEIVERGEGGPVRRRTVPCRFVPLLGSEGFDESRRRVDRPSCEVRRHRRCCAHPCSRAGSVSVRWRPSSSTPRSRRILGLEVHCGDGARRFLPFSTARRGEHGIEIDSTFTLLDSRELEFYRAHGRPLASAPELADARIETDGALVIPLSAHC